MACQYIPNRKFAFILCLLLGSFAVAGATSHSVPRNALGVAAKGTVTTPTITTTSLPGGGMGAPYMGPLCVTGGAPPYSWVVVGNGPRHQGLPTGLQLGSGLAPGTVAITGTPSVMGTYPIQVTVKDHAGNGASKQLYITISYMTLTITTASLPPATVNVPYSAALTAHGGLTPYAWARLSGSLPAGLTMTAVGTISGTPTTPGTSNFVVSVSDAELPPASARAALSITVASASDIYGGISSLPSPGGASGFFRLELAVKGNQQREMLVTPVGHYFYVRSVFVIDPSFIIQMEPDTYQARYNGSQSLFATHALNRMLTWGFNAGGEYSSTYTLPVGTWGGHTGNSVKVPFVMFLTTAGDLQTNPARLGMQQGDRVKNLTDGVPLSTFNDYRGRLLDVFAPQWAQAYAGEVAQANTAITGGFASVPWVVGITLEDADYFWALKGVGTCPTGSPYPHPSFLIATTNFTQNSGSGFTYTDSKVYSKYAWVDYLRSKYGSIGALNTAWGSRYTSFDDAGGYGTGTGVLDEDGRHTTWMGRDPYNLTGESTALQADMNGFLYQYTLRAWSVAVGAVRNGDNNHLLFGPSSLGGVGDCGIRAPVLHGLKDAGVQVLSADFDERYSDRNIRVMNSYYNEAGLPTLIWETITATSDSYWHSQGGGDFATQAIRGQNYAANQQLFYSAAGTDGVNYIIGTDWWAFTDSGRAEKNNFGLVSAHDNAYDGKCAVRTASVDPWGYACGGETADYGDFLDAVTQANSSIVQQLISDMSGRGGAH